MGIAKYHKGAFEVWDKSKLDSFINYGSAGSFVVRSRCRGNGDVLEFDLIQLSD
jgi:hypothetical protein